MTSLFELIPETSNAFNHLKISGNNNLQKKCLSAQNLVLVLKICLTQKNVTIKRYQSY